MTKLALQFCFRLTIIRPIALEIGKVNLDVTGCSLVLIMMTSTRVPGAGGTLGFAVASGPSFRRTETSAAPAGGLEQHRSASL